MPAIHGKGLSDKKAAKASATVTPALESGESIRLIVSALGYTSRFDGVVVTDRRIFAVNCSRRTVRTEIRLDEVTAFSGIDLPFTVKLVYSVGTAKNILRLMYPEDLQILLKVIDVVRSEKSNESRSDSVETTQKLAELMRARAMDLALTARAHRPVEPAPLPINSWPLAEQNAANWMRYLGFPDARITTGGSDGGVDVTASGAIAQVKFEASQVGRPALQRLVGARGLRHETQLLFFSGAGYSQQARTYADEVEMALFVYNLDGRVTARSSMARQLLRAVEPPHERRS
jgi:hypothetical protein